MTRHLPWIATAIIGVVALAVVALSRGENVNALWIVVASVSCFLVAYRYYALFIARHVMRLDASRPTPAIRRADGLDYVATDRTVLFGHHFAAIAGAGPLVGPVLAAQMGYLPGTLWIIFGVVLAGAVQDFMVLFISMRRDGKSLGELIRLEMGQAAGTIALFGAFMLMVIILAVLALIVVKALAESPWGMFTVAATVPLAMAMGAYTRWIRPGRIGEVSILGLIGLLAAIVYGQAVAQSPVWGPIFAFTPVQLCWILIGYGAVASVLPVWLLLAPRDSLSTYLKIGAIAALAIGIVIMAPPLRMPALTQFVAGNGPVWAGGLFPFLFITIACGAVSGFNALISSGTTPKLIASAAHAPMIGYGAMLMEAFACDWRVLRQWASHWQTAEPIPQSVAAEHAKRVGKRQSTVVWVGSDERYGGEALNLATMASSVSLTARDAVAFAVAVAKSSGTASSCCSTRLRPCFAAAAAMRGRSAAPTPRSISRAATCPPAAAASAAGAGGGAPRKIAVAEMVAMSETARSRRSPVQAWRRTRAVVSLMP